jgi:hypothetical protein
VYCISADSVRLNTEFYKYNNVLKSLLTSLYEREAPPIKARTMAPDGVLPRRDSPFVKEGKGDFFKLSVKSNA